MKKLIVASNNKGKLRELKELLADKYEVVSMAEMGYTAEIEENGSTFYENALIKAETVSKALNEDVLADDSGLCVDALNGAPGVFSARFSGEHGNDKENRKLLLEKLDGESNRKAKFRCVIVLYKKNGEIICGNGETNGKIGFEEVGNMGFGYDSIFISDDLGKCFGLASDEEKNSVSHRSRALKDLLRQL